MKGFPVLNRLFVLGILFLLAQKGISQNFYLDDLKAGNVFLMSSFKPGGASLTDEHMKTLDKLILGFEKYASLQIEVMGHTDFAGNPQANMKLSKARVESIKKYLVKNGVSKKKVKASHFGGAYPITRERSPEAVKLNRRVEILITKNYELGVNFQNRSHLTYTKTDQSNSQGFDTLSSGRRKALLIGNSNYQHTSRLKNPGNDVDLMAITLKDLGFEVTSRVDQNFNNLRITLQEFARDLSSNDVIFFYFAGHGMQFNGKNYLLPIDAELKNGARDLEFEAISVEVIFRILEYSNKESLNIIVLDACRNNNFPSSNRSGNVGLASIAPPSGTVIGFSTSPGSVAYDGDGNNGVYTKELAIELAKNQRIVDVFMNTRNNVERITRGSQSPWELYRLSKAYSLR